MKRKLSILIVEDETAIRDGLIDVLVFHGYQVESTGDGVVGLEMATSGKFDLILLDVMLPGMNGYEICDQIRQRDKDQAIMMLTAKVAEEDIINGLKLGADDYVAKPFSITELTLRIEALMRRTVSAKAMVKTLVVDPALVIDCDNLSANCDDAPISFTRRELDILQYLFAHHQRAVPRDELLSEVWGYAKDADIETRTVDIHVAKLRRKIEKEPKDPRRLLTVRGAGYRLMVAVTDQ
ncbi:MAG: response regulator transcription factor [Gammaproteobacteria bacterium]